jgi:hypothetical protein
MLFEVNKKSNMPKDRFYPWFAVATSCLFTALIIVHSLRQGRLSVPVSFDQAGTGNSSLPITTAGPNELVFVFANPGSAQSCVISNAAALSWSTSLKH